MTNPYESPKTPVNRAEKEYDYVPIRTAVLWICAMLSVCVFGVTSYQALATASANAGFDFFREGPFRKVVLGSLYLGPFVLTSVAIMLLSWTHMPPDRKVFGLIPIGCLLLLWIVGIIVMNLG